MAAALFNTGSIDFTAFAEYQQDQGFAFQSLGDGFGGVKLAVLMLLLKLFADFVLPIFTAARPGQDFFGGGAGFGGGWGGLGR